MNFAIVEFLESQEIEVVSCKWIKERHCFWPPFNKSKKIRTLVEKHVVPDESWSVHPAKIIDLFETYESARTRLSKAEETSDLASELENKGRGKRFKRKRKYSSSSYSTTVSETLIPPSPPHGQNLLNSFTLNTNELEHNSPSLLRATVNSGTGDHNFQRTVMREFMLIKEMQRQQSETLQLILNKLNERPSNSKDKTTDLCEIKEILDKLPLKTTTELESLDLLLLDANIFDSLCHYLSMSGGTSSGNCTINILKKLMTNELASEFSYFGARDKKAFKGLNMKQLVFDAVRRTPQYSKTTDGEMKIAIMNWLHHAKARFMNERIKHFS